MNPTLAKSSGGEGSRGGKVIGHTKSGKPIYEHGNDHGADWSKQDHADAHALHRNMAAVANSQKLHHWHFQDVRDAEKKDWLSPEQVMNRMRNHPNQRATQEVYRLHHAAAKHTKLAQDHLEVARQNPKGKSTK